MLEIIYGMISWAFLMLFGILVLAVDVLLSNWEKVLVLLIVLYVIAMYMGKINALNERVKILERKVNDENINAIIDDRLNYSLTYVYNENECLGHEWTYKISEGHWATLIYDEINGKSIVKHYRTQNKVKEESDILKRFDDDMAYNKEKIYGDDRTIANVSGMEKKNGIYVPKS
jgi:hypothetical protein